MAQAIISPDQDSVISEIEIAAPPARVFEALTDEKQLFQWFTNPSCPVKFWKMDARPGGRYGYSTVKGTMVHNGVGEFECSGEILEYDPPRLLVYTWVANWHDDKTRRTIVRWELTPIAKGTQVKVTHSGLAQEEASCKGYSGGWVGVVEGLKKFVER
jgi:uncharacterized protein YndB with AHSA1/START domain